jgi:hypothetical protein
MGNLIFQTLSNTRTVPHLFSQKVVLGFYTVQSKSQLVQRGYQNRYFTPGLASSLHKLNS